jgi:ParB-like chromosome segregation protein Spo0J
MTVDASLTIAMAKRIELWPLERLRPYDRNARTHSAEQVAQIAASIVEFGFTNPILVDSSDGIIAGHGRLSAAQELGLKTVPVVVLDHLSDRQRKAYILADNQLALNAGWDTDLLRSELQDLAEQDFDLSLIGFSDDELADLLPEIEELPPEDADADAVPEPPAEPVTKPGDIWLLGEHRLMCGDSTDVLAVELFAAPDGSLIVNEIAPRTHNSGHLTIEACDTSQFEQQVRAVCGLPLGATRLRAPAAMANLLGECWERGEPDWAAALSVEGVSLHLYGKSAPRPGRKMGHLTAVAATVDEARDAALNARRLLSRHAVG